jgi:hypothetical protein
VPSELLLLNQFDGGLIREKCLDHSGGIVKARLK